MQSPRISISPQLISSVPVEFGSLFSVAASVLAGLLCFS